jgi:hypothetical protein
MLKVRSLEYIVVDVDEFYTSKKNALVVVILWVKSTSVGYTVQTAKNLFLGDVIAGQTLPK